MQTLPPPTHLSPGERKSVGTDISVGFTKSNRDEPVRSPPAVSRSRECDAATALKALLMPMTLEQYAKWQKHHEARKAFKAAQKK